MGRKKIKIKYIQDRLKRQITASQHRIGIFGKADALAKFCNVEVAVLLIPSNGRTYVFGSPCFNSVVGRFKNPNLQRSERSSPLQTRILESQAKLDELKEELKHQKEHEKVLKKRQKEILERYGRIDLTLEDFIAFKEKLEEVRDDLERYGKIDLTLEDLIAFKEKLEEVRDYMKRKFVEMEASSS